MNSEETQSPPVPSRSDRSASLPTCAGGESEASKPQGSSALAEQHPIQLVHRGGLHWDIHSPRERIYTVRGDLGRLFVHSECGAACMGPFATPAFAIGFAVRDLVNEASGITEQFIASQIAAEWQQLETTSHD